VTLRLEGIEAAYGLSQVLFGISLEVPSGRLVTLLGRNGMGKTTTVRAMMGLVPIQAGRVHFGGRPLHGLPSYIVARAGLGLVPEGRQVFSNLTVRENLVATAANRSKTAAPWTLANFMLEGGGIKEYAKAKALFYSDRVLFDKLLEKLSIAVANFLHLQIDAGADAVQIFDSLGGVLSDADFEAASARYRR